VLIVLLFIYHRQMLVYQYHICYHSPEKKIIKENSLGFLNKSTKLFMSFVL
jgi:hypothetical protein